jgi:hypothetical protein
MLKFQQQVLKILKKRLLKQIRLGAHLNGAISMPHERAKILYKVADIIEARVDEFQNYKPVIMVSLWQKRVV